ncbi:MAG: hypothetical protein ACLU38_13185 [Dysosmobacter sp.]
MNSALVWLRRRSSGRFAMWERAQLYDWCLCGGDYSLVAYAEKMTPLFLESFRVGE